MKEDIIENLSMASPEDPWPWLKLAAVLLLICTPVVFWFLRRRRSGGLAFRPPVSPDRSALDRLAAIFHLIEEGLVREFVREASDILRGYIEARFALRSPMLSTEEFLYEAERSERLDDSDRARLADFLFGCDRVKFALGNLDRAQMEELYRAAETFIQQSTIRPEEPLRP